MIPLLYNKGSIHKIKRLLNFSIGRTLDVSILNCETFPHFGRNFDFIDAESCLTMKSVHLTHILDYKSCSYMCELGLC